jgi:hypothetical protein
MLDYMMLEIVFIILILIFWILANLKRCQISEIAKIL